MSVYDKLLCAREGCGDPRYRHAPDGCRATGSERCTCTSFLDPLDQDWGVWWTELRDDLRQWVEDYEAKIGTTLTWNQRYLLCRNWTAGS